MVGSREEAIVNKVKTRARQYPWGTVEGKRKRNLITTAVYMQNTLCEVTIAILVFQSSFVRNDKYLSLVEFY